MAEQMIDYAIRRKSVDETPTDAANAAKGTSGDLVTTVRCCNCDAIVCIAQADNWPPTRTVTLHIGIDWDEPQIFGDLILCGECGGPTTNV